MRRALCAVTTLVLVLAGARPAAAGWSALDARIAWSAFQKTFQYTNGAVDRYDFSTNAMSDGPAHQQNFWEEAELIEMAEDAYAENHTTNNRAEVQGLCHGFVALHGDDWSSNVFDDDLNWATIAFIRAYSITGNKRWLNDAETNFNTVWRRGFDMTWGGGLWWRSDKEDEHSGYKNSPANWTFVIAGHLINDCNGGNGPYLSHAQTIYNWCTNHLSTPAGEVYDGLRKNRVAHKSYTYNYGIAVGAALASGDRTLVQNAANFLMTNSAYRSGSVGGYDILPNYGQGGGDAGGFNDIVFRWFNAAYQKGLMPGRYLPWAQTNVSQAWAERNVTAISWNNWNAPTPPHG
ncbi:MAG TPA: glycoside hydrolase family 76 protein, partial [Candidatus Sulfotelmatobacter sp.]|nr:glycoside hydrolase family 76 protein [Candidatus Sulfotelmatobacter sp.]